jgi:hypothetical protein
MKEDTLYVRSENMTNLGIAIRLFKDLVFPAGLHTDPNWDDDSKKVQLVYIRYVVGGFFRKEFSKCFPLWEVLPDLGQDRYLLGG